MLSLCWCSFSMSTLFAEVKYTYVHLNLNWQSTKFGQMYKLIESGTFYFHIALFSISLVPSHSLNLMPRFQFYNHSMWHSLQQALILFSINTHLYAIFFSSSLIAVYISIKNTDHLHVIYCVKPSIWIQDVFNYIQWNFQSHCTCSQSISSSSFEFFFVSAKNWNQI